MAAGNTAEACARFAESYRFEASSGTLINLALCHEKEGKIATAWAEYRDAARVARDWGRKESRRGRERQGCRARAEGSPSDDGRARKRGRGPRRLERGALTDGGRIRPVAVPNRPRRTRGHGGRAAPAEPGPTTVQVGEGEQRTLEIPPLEEEPAFVNTAAVPKRVEDPLTVAATSPAPTGWSRFRSSPVRLLHGGRRGTIIVAGGITYGIAYAKLGSAKDACNQPPSCPDYSARVSTINTWKYIAVGILHRRGRRRGGVRIALPLLDAQAARRRRYRSGERWNPPARHVRLRPRVVSSVTLLTQNE